MSRSGSKTGESGLEDRRINSPTSPQRTEFLAPFALHWRNLKTVFSNGVFTLKTRQMFFVHTTLEKFENATITGHFGFLFEENSEREITWLSSGHVLFTKSFVFEMVSVQNETQSPRIQIPPVWRAFLHFSGVVDGAWILRNATKCLFTETYHFFIKTTPYLIKTS